MALRWQAMNADEKADKLRDELDELRRDIRPKRIDEIEKQLKDQGAHISSLAAMVANLINQMKRAEEA